METRKKKSVEERFWMRVDRRGPNECWLWKGTRNSKGYGDFNIVGRKGPRRAHILSFISHYGPVPEGKVIMHTCDVRLCVNPAHLKAGTVEENNRDAMMKGHIRLVLDPDKVRAIRLRYANGEFQRALGRDYGVSQFVISMVVRRRMWRHVE